MYFSFYREKNMAGEMKGKRDARSDISGTKYNGLLDKTLFEKALMFCKALNDL